MRRALTIAIAGFMLASPAYRVLGGRSPWLRDWMLYRDVGVGLVEAEFSREGEGVDRFVVLGGAPRSLTHIDGEAGLFRVCKQLCAALGPGLRVRARLATIDGWAVIDDGSHDRCETQPPRTMRLDATPRKLHD